MDKIKERRRDLIDFLPNSPRFPISMKFVNGIRPNYQDNSLLKSINSRKYLDSKTESLTQSRNELRHVLTAHRLLNQRVESLNSEYFEYFNNVCRFEQAENIMNQAAVTIQKWVKGFLARRKTDEALLSILRKHHGSNIEELVNKSSFCLLNVGKKPREAAIILQRAVRKRRFLHKIYRITTAYEAFKEDREKETTDKLKKYMRFFCCKNRLEELTWLRYKTAKLKKIRRKLAVLAIKVAVKREKINIRLMKVKIRKYRRTASLRSSPVRTKHRKAKEIFKTDGQLLATASDDSGTINEEASSTNTEAEQKEKALKLELEKKEKLSLCLISYQVKRGRYKFYRKLRKDSSNSIVASSNDSINLKNNQSKTPIPTSIQKNPEKASISLRTKSTAAKKISEEYRKGNYLRDTICSEFNKSKPVAENEPKEISPNYKYLSRGKVLLPTLSSKVKLKSKHSFTINPKWNIKMTYTPSINNPDFYPERQHYSNTPSPLILLQNDSVLVPPKPSKNCLRVSQSISLSEAYPNLPVLIPYSPNPFRSNLKLNTYKVQGYARSKISTHSELT